MSASRGLALLAIVVLCALGCEERPRTNPFDPMNPDTGGGPLTFRALADDQGVKLEWSPGTGREGVLGFELARRRANTPDDFTPLDDILPLSSRGFDDASAQVDIDYEYRLSFVNLDSVLTGRPATALARPGREVPWIADAARDELIRLTPDGRERVLTVSGVRTVNRIAIDPLDGAVWATEPFDARAKVFSSTGAPISTFSGGLNPNAVAVDPVTHTAWICNENDGRVLRFVRSGVVAADGGFFGNPQDVAITVSSNAWIVDTEAGTIVPLAPDGTRGTPVNVGADPRRLAVDLLDGSVWVSRYAANEVVHVSAAGVVLSRTALPGGPYAIDLDELRNRVWVGMDIAESVIALDRATGTEVLRVPGIARPRGLSVADRTGEVWVCAIATGQLVRISSDGVVQLRRAGFDAPIDVEVDPGPRPPP